MKIRVLIALLKGYTTFVTNLQRVCLHIIKLHKLVSLWQSDSFMNRSLSVFSNIYIHIYACVRK